MSHLRAMRAPSCCGGGEQQFKSCPGAPPSHLLHVHVPSTCPRTCCTCTCPPRALAPAARARARTRPGSRPGAARCGSESGRRPLRGAEEHVEQAKLGAQWRARSTARQGAQHACVCQPPCACACAPASPDLPRQAVRAAVQPHERAVEEDVHAAGGFVRHKGSVVRKEAVCPCHRSTAQRLTGQTPQHMAASTAHGSTARPAPPCTCSRAAPPIPRSALQQNKAHLFPCSSASARLPSGSVPSAVSSRTSGASSPSGQREERTTGGEGRGCLRRAHRARAMFEEGP
jgi:hypothetical protein